MPPQNLPPMPSLSWIIVLFTHEKYAVQCGGILLSMMTHATHADFAHPARILLGFGIEPGMKVADFGAGSGAYTLHMAQALAGSGQVYAIDIQHDLLRRLHNEATRQHLTVLSTIWADLECVGASKLADHYVDVVLISNLLFQIEHKDAVLLEAARIVRPRGRVIVIDWNEAPRIGRSSLGPPAMHVVSKQTARELGEAAGLIYEREIHVGGHHYGLAFRAPTY